MNDRHYVALCTNCGAALKNVVYIGDLPYGHDCAEIVTGVRFEDMATRRAAAADRLEYDAEATAARKRERAERIERQNAERAEFERTRAEREAAVAVSQAWLVEAIMPADHILGDRCECFGCAIARECRRIPVAEQSPRVVEILRDKYAGAHGRRNSKKYNAAAAEFDARLGFDEGED